ncbi:SDR family NAD(P)-dependent oxidoreductase [Calothrix sp. CCY 0018]|uniref:SDR family NAD(P)-dependent oxidoreductase n=1 Tax=Calothrix sp. CCY 0018 TaxID=3103864 RepID=UPI0039C6111F
MPTLNGKIAFIAGGAGNVGEGIVRSFLKAGATVITTSRKQEKLEELRGYLGDLAKDNFVPIVGDLGNLESAEKLRNQIIEKFNRLDAVVASVGGTWSGVPMTQVSMEDWQKFIFTNLTTHFVCARTFLPVLVENKGSSYTFLGGSAAENAIPNYSLVAITAAGQLMMAKVLMEEMKDSGVRINEVMVNSLVNTRATEENAKPEWITADEIGDYVAWLASDEAHMVNSSVPYLQEQNR